MAAFGSGSGILVRAPAPRARARRRPPPRAWPRARARTGAAARCRARAHDRLLDRERIDVQAVRVVGGAADPRQPQRRVIADDEHDVGEQEREQRPVARDAVRVDERQRRARAPRPAATAAGSAATRTRASRAGTGAREPRARALFGSQREPRRATRARPRRGRARDAARRAGARAGPTMPASRARRRAEARPAASTASRSRRAETDWRETRRAGRRRRQSRRRAPEVAPGDGRARYSAHVSALDSPATRIVKTRGGHQRRVDAQDARHRERHQRGVREPALRDQESGEDEENLDAQGAEVRVGGNALKRLVEPAPGERVAVEQDHRRRREEADQRARCCRARRARGRGVEPARRALRRRSVSRIARRRELVERVDVAERVGLVVERDLDDASAAYHASILRPPDARNASRCRARPRARARTPDAAGRRSARPRAARRWPRARAEPLDQVLRQERRIAGDRHRVARRRGREARVQGRRAVRRSRRPHRARRDGRTAHSLGVLVRVDDERADLRSKARDDAATIGAPRNGRAPCRRRPSGVPAAGEHDPGDVHRLHQDGGEASAGSHGTCSS